jgi:hypothetical protein
VKSAPATPYTITAAFLRNGLFENYASVGVAFRQSSDGKLVLFGTGASGSGFDAYRLMRYTNATTYSSDYLSLRSAPHYLTFMQISDNGTNRITRISADGQHWIQIHSVTRTDHLTADQVGFFAESNNATYDIGMTLVSWKAT